MTRLTGQEKETIICFNEQDDTAAIFTYNKAWQKHLEVKLGLKPTMNNGFGGKEYELPKKRIRPPRAPKKLSAEVKERLSANLKNTRNLRAENTNILGKSGGRDVS
jgi:hypothetical protein